MIGTAKVLANLMSQVSMTKMALAAYADMQAAPRMQTWARANKPWHDISSEAKQGLKGGTVMRGDKVIIYIAHSVDYGIYLELANDKKYEILDPTIDQFKDRVYKDYARILRM